MSQIPHKKTEAFTGTRVTITTRVSYDEVFDRLSNEIKVNGVVTGEDLKVAATEGKEAFVSYFSNKVGPLGFVQFYDVNHGPWIRLFGVGNELRLHRVLLGNALIAIKMLELDLYSGLFVPVELLLKETPEGGAEVVYVLPSSLIAGVNQNKKLGAAAQALDNKLGNLVAYITA
jgi:uncharacterized protein (DUF302 family)